MTPIKRIAVGFVVACLVLAAGCEGDRQMQRNREQATDRWETSRGDMAYRLAKGCHDRGEIGAARRHVDDALRKGVRHAPLFALAARLALEEGEMGLAIRYAEAACQLDPDYADATYVLGTIEHAIGKDEQALRHFREASGQAPGESAYPLAEAELLVERDRPAEAADVLNRAIARMAGKAELHAGLGDVRAVQGRYPEAAESYRLAIRLDPSRGELRQRLASALFFAGAYDQAEPILAVLTEASSGDTAQWALRMRAECLMAMGRTEAARKVYKQLLRSEPEAVEPIVALAKCDLSAGRREDARVWIRRALAAERNHPEANALMGYLLVMEGRPAEAVPYLQRALHDPSLEGRETVEGLLARARREAVGRSR